VIAQVVRFKSSLRDEEVRSTFEARAPRYRTVPGLRQKIYLRFPDTGEYGAVYLWNSIQSLSEFRESELARTIPSAYRVDGPPQVELAEVLLILHEDLEQLAPMATGR